MFEALKKRFRGSSPEAEDVSYIGSETVISGDINSPAPVAVAGRIEGNVTCSVLRQLHTGTVIGSITVEEAHLSGLVRGDVVADRVRLAATARLLGDVRCSRISVADGASMEGQVIQKGSDPKLVSLQAVPGFKPSIEGP